MHLLAYFPIEDFRGIQRQQITIAQPRKAAEQEHPHHVLFRFRKALPPVHKVQVQAFKFPNRQKTATRKYPADLNFFEGVATHQAIGHHLAGEYPQHRKGLVHRGGLVAPLLQEDNHVVQILD